MEFIVNRLSSGQDITGEWWSNFDFEFILDIPVSISVFGINYVIDRIYMYSEYDEPVYRYGNSEKRFDGFDISKGHLKKIHIILKKEEENGKLKGYIFSDEIREMLEEQGIEFDEDGLMII